MNCWQTKGNWLGVPDVTNTIGMTSSWYMANRYSPSDIHAYRWGFGPSTWDVRFGVDQNDNEYDCGGTMAGNSEPNYLAIYVREAGSTDPSAALAARRRRPIAR